jgi:signal transduction histidine kinase
METRPREPTAASLPDGQTVLFWSTVIAATVVSATALAALVVTARVAPATALANADRPIALKPPAVVLIAVIVLTCWRLVADHPRSALGLALLGVSWILPALAAWPLLAAPVRAAVLACGPLGAAGIALIVVGWRLPETAPRIPLRAAITLAIAASMVHLFGYDPFFDVACSRTCSASPAVLAGIMTSGEAVVIVAALTAAACVAAAAACVLSAGTPMTMRATGTVSAVLIALSAFTRARGWGGDAAFAVEDIVETVGVGLLAVAALVEQVRTLRIRRDVRTVVEHLSGWPRITSRGSSVTAVHFAAPPAGHWVDLAGHEMTTTISADRCLVLSDASGPAVRLVLTRWAEPREVLASITPAGRLMLENARLHATNLVHLAEVEASQRRIVEAIDRERYCVERDIHDGAQQRLVAVVMHLSWADNHFGAAAPGGLAVARAHVHQAIAALRDLSHDSLAPALGAEGLAAGLEDLVAGMPLTVEVDMPPVARGIPTSVQSVAYLAVKVALDNVAAHARTDHARLVVINEGDDLVVQVSDDGQGGAVVGPGLREIADRVSALGGSLDIVSDPDCGTALTVRLRCAP